MRMTTVLNPKAARSDNRRYVLRDFAYVPCLETYGSWKVVDMLHPEKRAGLARLTNLLEREQRNQAALVRGHLFNK